MPIRLLALALSAFAIGTTEFVIVGLVPSIAQYLGVSLRSAGLSASLYALGVAIGAPVLTTLTGRWNRRMVLLTIMSLFVIGGLLAWLAHNYNSLIAARVLTGLTHGVFFSIGSTIATGLVAKEKEVMRVYGVSAAVGIIWGGRLADRMGPVEALSIIFAVLGLVLLAFLFTARHQVGAVLTVLIWDIFAFGDVPGLQVHVLQLAEAHTQQAVDVASGLNIAAFNVGIAIGSVMRGAIIDGMSLMDVLWTGALIVVLALQLTRLFGTLDKRHLAQVI